MLTFLKRLKRLGSKQKYIAEKVDFEILRWHSVPFNDFWGHTLFDKKKLRLDNVSNDRHFHQNGFINEYATKKKAKIP